MITVRNFSDRDVGIFGLARSGLSSIVALKAGGARIFAWDEREEAREKAAALGAQVAPFASWPWQHVRTLVLSPGVALNHPRPHPAVLAARGAGAEVIGDVELFAREIRPDPSRPGHAPVIAVTGTNGKSTTTALLGNVLQACGFPVEVGGNIGKPVLELGGPNGRTIYALEISSYQIELAPGLAPDVSVLTNITPDHIERHGSLASYAAVKARLLDQAAPGAHIVVGVDDAHSAAIYSRLTPVRGANAIPVSVGKVLGRGVFVVDGWLYDAWAGSAAKVMNLAQLSRLPGTHNWQNAALAYAAARPFVKDSRAIASAIAGFPGLAHRIEDIGRVNKVRFVNDSKATNADAAAKALVCFSDVYWIVGGRPKEGGIEFLLAHAPRIRKAYLIGEAAEDFERTLRERIACERSGTLDAAVNAAFGDALRSNAAAPVVLLSPACASFDQFRDFEERGERFRALVEDLAGFARKEAS